MKKHIFLLLGIISFGLIFIGCDDDDKGGKAVNVTITQAKLLTGDIFAINVQESTPIQLEAFIMPQSAAGAPISYTFKGTPSGAFDMTETGMITPRAKTPAQGEIPEPLGADTIIATVNDGSGTFVRYPVRIISDTILVSSITLAPAGQFMEISNGRTFDLSKYVTINPANATRKAIKYSSADESIATVDQNGLVTATGVEGQKAEISVTALDRGGVSAVGTVVVAAQPPKYMSLVPDGFEATSNLATKEGTFANLFDDKPNTFWAPDITTRPNYDPVCWLQIDLKNVIRFGQLGYKHRGGGFEGYAHMQCHTFKMEVKKAVGDEWIDLGEFETKPKILDYQLFQAPEDKEPMDVQFIRITFIKGHLRDGKPDWNYSEGGNVSIGDLLIYEYNWD